MQCLTCLFGRTSESSSRTFRPENVQESSSTLQPMRRQYHNNTLYDIDPYEQDSICLLSFWLLPFDFLALVSTSWFSYSFIISYSQHSHYIIIILFLLYFIFTIYYSYLVILFIFIIILISNIFYVNIILYFIMQNI